MKYINKYVRSILHSLSMVCRGGGIGGDSVRVLGCAVVGHLGHISVVVVDVVVHVLDPAVRKGNRVGALSVAGTIAALSGVEVGVGVVVGDGVVVSVGGDLVRVHLGNSVGNRVGNSVRDHRGSMDNRGSVHNRGGMDDRGSVYNRGNSVSNTMPNHSMTPEDLGGR